MLFKGRRPCGYQVRANRTRFTLQAVDQLGKLGTVVGRQRSLQSSQLVRYTLQIHGHHIGQHVGTTQIQVVAFQITMIQGVIRKGGHTLWHGSLQCC